MPNPKRPRVASPDEVKISRDGDYAIIEYADPQVSTTHFKIGKDKLAAMTDGDILARWNDGIEAADEFIRAYEYKAVEIPVGKPQVRYSATSDQWVPRGDVVRCVVINGRPDTMQDGVVAIDDRDFTAEEFLGMLSTFEGWGMRIEFVPDGEAHERPEIEVREPEE